eukprot:COSAG05_NODE_8631_length_686_cov_0.863714_1_plen_174_part_00
MISSGLMEFLHKSNLDDPTNWDSRCCHQKSVGRWGANTCIPDIKTTCIQEYYTQWGRIFLDAGSRALFFGQARLTGGGRACNSDGTGCSRVSKDGAAGFQVVVANLREYAHNKGYGRIYLGPQAASGFELVDGTELADWVYGAQHLFASRQWLVQPFSVNGTEPRRREYYGCY